MVRPKEQSLSQEELEAVRRNVTMPYTVELDLRSGKIADVFARCCGKAVSKDYLLECNWILEPLVTLHPKAALATDSLWELMKILGQDKSPVPIPEVVALDLRHLLGSLKKTKRQLRSESKRRGLDPEAWLERTTLDPRLVKLLQLVERPARPQEKWMLQTMKKCSVKKTCSFLPRDRRRKTPMLQMAGPSRRMCQRPMWPPRLLLML